MGISRPGLIFLFLGGAAAYIYQHNEAHRKDEAPARENNYLHTPLSDVQASNHGAFLSTGTSSSLSPNFQGALVATLLFACAFIAAAAGVGGGGIFVPLLVGVAGFSPKEAVPIAQAMIFCGSIINLSYFIGQRHPLSPKEGPPRAKIDYDGVVLLEPMLCVGLTLGVLIHHAAPDWFLIVLLWLTLVPAISKTFKKAVQQHRQEAEARASGAPEPAPQTDGGFRDMVELLGQNLRAILVTILIWGFVFITMMFNQSVCTALGAVMLVSLTGALLLMNWAVYRWVITDTDKLSPDAQRTVVQWRSGSAYWYPFISSIAGFLGGLLGIGGGIVMSPVLLEIGMHAEAVQATTAMFVLLSSSLASVQFAIHGRYTQPLYLLWFCAIAFVGTLAGQWFCEVFVRRKRRFSLITGAITCILAGSFVALAIIGTSQVYQEYFYGTSEAFMFRWNKICMASGGGDSHVIMPYEEQPFEQWGVWQSHKPHPPPFPAPLYYPN